jgi:carbon storage regulator
MKFFKEGTSMLVLTRKPGESIVIGDNIRLTVVTLGPGRVKIGIEAPADVTVNRAEIQAKIAEEQEESTESLPTPHVINAGKVGATALHNRIAERLEESRGNNRDSRYSANQFPPRKSR